MKKRILLLLPLFLGACSKGEESPLIKVEKLYISDDAEVNYANDMEALPALKDGDEVTAGLLLDGNGSELKTFSLEKDGQIDTKINYQPTEVSTEGNLTDEEQGRLRFKDGITQTHVMVKATAHVDKEGNAKLVFYLSSKAECEGAQEAIYLKTTVSE